MPDVDFFNDKLNRLKTVLGVTKDKEVGEALSLKEKAFNARKTRGSFPEKELRALAQQRPELGIDVDYVLTGHGASTAGLDRARADGSLAIWQQSHEPGTAKEQRRRANAQASNPEALPMQPDEELLLAAYRAADIKGRAAVLLAAQGIAALASSKAARGGQ